MICLGVRAEFSQKPHMTWKSVLEPGLSGKSYVVNVPKPWHLLSAKGRTAVNDGTLTDIRIGHLTL